MKKSLLMLGAAAMMLASCTQNEVMEVAESRAIGFDAFVNNSTKAVEEITKDNIEDFWVFGGYNSDADNWVNFYTNVQVEGAAAGTATSNTWTPKELAYWQIDKMHNFGAYANGKSGLTTGVSYNAKDNKLTFSNYSGGESDLIAATASGLTWNGTDPATPNKVSFTFKHMLSKIVFTFKTQASKDYIMKVTNLKINGVAEPASGAIKAANGTLTDETVAWEATGTNGEYTFADIADYADGTQGTDGYFSKASEARFVIPQDNTNLTASFHIAVYAESAPETVLWEKDFNGISLKYNSTGLGTANEWTEGFYYNYIAIINPDQVDPDGETTPIEFTVNTVEGWTEANDNTIVQPQP